MSIGALRGHPYYLLSPGPLHGVHPVPVDPGGRRTGHGRGQTDASSSPASGAPHHGGPVRPDHRHRPPTLPRRHAAPGHPDRHRHQSAPSAPVPPLVRQPRCADDRGRDGMLRTGAALRVLQRARVGLADAALVGGTLGLPPALMRLNIALTASVLVLAFGTVCSAREAPSTSDSGSWASRWRCRCWWPAACTWRSTPSSTTGACFPRGDVHGAGRLHVLRRDPAQPSVEGHRQPTARDALLLDDDLAVVLPVRQPAGPTARSPHRTPWSG